MLSWASLITTGLKAVLALVNWANRRQLLDAGQDQAVARQALAVLEATEEGKRLRDRIKQMSDSDADKLWNEMLGQ